MGKQPKSGSELAAMLWQASNSETEVWPSDKAGDCRIREFRFYSLRFSLVVGISEDGTKFKTISYSRAWEENNGIWLAQVWENGQNGPRIENYIDDARYFFARGAIAATKEAAILAQRTKTLTS